MYYDNDVLSSDDLRDDLVADADLAMYEFVHSCDAFLFDPYPDEEALFASFDS